jgi:glucan biosynthesis protein C
MNIKTEDLQRRYDLDWLRVLAILAIFFYHSFRFFNLETWHIKNSITYPSIDVLTNFVDIWMMPFVFLISGASLFYAVRKGGAVKFIKDKVLRLLIPLVVGIFTHIILQVYLERMALGQFKGTFFQFLPHYFDGLYLEIGNASGNFSVAGHHLWYLEILFLFSIILLPLFLWLKSSLGVRLLEWLSKFFALPGGIYLLALVALMSWKLIKPDSFLGFDAFNWNLGVYLSFLLTGYVIIASAPLQASIQRLHWLSLVGAIASTIWFFTTREYEGLALWFWILTFLGFGMKSLNFNTPILKYANEAVLPFYILHQTVLVGIGYFVVQWQIPDPLKWLVIAATSFGISLGLYEYLVRRYNPLRVLFGMKPLARSAFEPVGKAVLAGVKID